MHKIENVDGEYQKVLSRILIIDEHIRRGDYPSQTRLAKLCGVSSKTIQRDLNHLQYTIGAPLEYDASKKGWFYKTGGFYLPTRYATKTDLQALLVMGEMVAQYEGTPLGASIQDAYNTMLDLFKNEDAAKLRRLTKKIRFDSMPSAPIDPDVWTAVLSSLRDDQRIELDYSKGGHEPLVTRRFDPFGLIVRSRDWFLYGYCHLRKRRLHLAVPFIKRAVLVDDYFDVPANFDLTQYVQNGFQALQSDGQPDHTVVLRFPPELADLQAVRPLARGQTFEREPSGHARVSFKASALFQVEREVLSWGEKVEVLEPPILRENIRKTVEKIAKFYAKP